MWKNAMNPTGNRKQEIESTEMCATPIESCYVRNRIIGKCATFI